ncbi:DMT family transporter [uncultured Corynebacterium sp.]|uniref:DMT family transporter n=1 Tax=uncultured Corynebacterium sp. TaxID=159447 RepID=UPI0025F4D160|nr:EamA family transporter [uncultured Corynebacterium sp.]
MNARSTPSTLPALLAVMTTAVLWGTTGTAATFSDGVGPLATGAAALGVGGILQALIALPDLRRHRRTLLERRGLVAVGALAVVVYPLTFYSSMHLAGVAVGTVVSLASAPLFAGVLEWTTTRRPPSRRWFLALVPGAIGAVLLCTSHGGGSGTVDADGVVPGVLLGLLAGASYAVYSWASFQLMVSTSACPVSRGAAMGSVFGLGGLMLLPVLAVTGAPILDSWQNVSVATYMAIVPMFLGYVLFGYGLTRLSPSMATTVTLLEPAVAALLAVVVIGEQLSGSGWAGMACVGLALVVLVAPQPRGRVRPRNRGVAQPSPSSRRRSTAAS